MNTEQSICETEQLPRIHRGSVTEPRLNTDGDGVDRCEYERVCTLSSTQSTGSTQEFRVPFIMKALVQHMSGLCMFVILYISLMFG